jgi:hypothetical protein
MIPPQHHPQSSMIPVQLSPHYVGTGLYKLMEYLDLLEWVFTSSNCQATVTLRQVFSSPPTKGRANGVCLFHYVRCWDMLHTVTTYTRVPIFVLSMIQHHNYRMSIKSSLNGNTVVVTGWIKHNRWHKWVILLRKRQKLSFGMPLALANNSQLKNVTLCHPNRLWPG